MYLKPESRQVRRYVSGGLFVYIWGDFVGGFSRDSVL